jgi:hypothetical protein
MPSTLLQLLDSSGLDEIIGGMSDGRLVHIARGCRLPPTSLFSIRAMERLLLQDALDRSLSVTVNGHPVNLEKMEVVGNGRLRHLALRRMTREGASIILNDLERLVPELWELACDAEHRLRDRVRILAVGSFSRLPASKAHYQPSDQILVQIEGSKIWRFFGDQTDGAAGTHAGVSPPQVSATVKMDAGDILFVPAGLHHQCEAEGISLHISLTVERATLGNVLDDLFSRHPLLSRPLRAIQGSENLAREVDCLGREIIAGLDEIDAAAWVADWNGRRARVTSLALAGDDEVADEDALASLALTLVPDGRAGDRWKVKGTVVDLDAGIVAMLRMLEAGSRPVRDLLEAAGRSVEPDAAQAAFGALVAKGIVRIDAVAPAAGGKCD